VLVNVWSHAVFQGTYVVEFVIKVHYEISWPQIIEKIDISLFTFVQLIGCFLHIFLSYRTRRLKISIAITLFGCNLVLFKYICCDLPYADELCSDVIYTHTTILKKNFYQILSTIILI
jgi:hypothetical protein